MHAIVRELKGKAKLKARQYQGSEPTTLDCGRVDPGDWIVSDAKGRELAVPHRDFAKRYKLLEEIPAEERGR